MLPSKIEVGNSIQGRRAESITCTCVTDAGEFRIFARDKRRDQKIQSRYRAACNGSFGRYGIRGPRARVPGPRASSRGSGANQRRSLGQRQFRYGVHSHGRERKDSTGAITSEEAIGVDHKLTEVLTPTQVLTVAPEINRLAVAASPGSSTPAHRQDSGPAIGLNASCARSRASVRPRFVSVKMRLIALWHQSLAQSEQSRGKTLFANSKKADRKKVRHTAETNHWWKYEVLVRTAALRATLVQALTFPAQEKFLSRSLRAHKPYCREKEDRSHNRN